MIVFIFYFQGILGCLLRCKEEPNPKNIPGIGH